MAIRTQRWVPDTHPGFQLDTEWSYPDMPDGGWPDPENVPSPTFVRCFRATKDGVDYPGPDALYALILSENQTKNRAIAALGAALPGLEPVWVFGDVDGVVHISLPGATPLQRSEAQVALEEFGGAVVLD